MISASEANNSYLLKHKSQDSCYRYQIQPFYRSTNSALQEESKSRGKIKGQGLATVPQAGWREGVKEEIPNLLIYHVKAHSVLTHDETGRLTTQFF